MKFKKSVFVLLILSFCLLCSCQNAEVTDIKIPETTGNFDFTIFKAGQADAIFLETANNSIIIDCGEKDDGDEIVEFLKEKNIKNVDYIFITHFDKDHVGGFPEVMDNVTASNIIVSDYVGNNEEYEEYLKTVNDKKLKITALSDDTTFVIDDVLFEVSTPDKKSYVEGDNDFSLVISVTHGENTFLFAADAEKERLPEILRVFGHEYDFLKVPHHGKYNKHTKRFINTVKPDYAVICDSEKHPAEEELISLLNSAGSTIYSTKDGNVFVSSNGKEIKVKQ